MLFKKRVLCSKQHRYQNEDIRSKQLETRIQSNAISTSLLTLHQSLFVVVDQHLISLPAFHYQNRLYRRNLLDITRSGIKFSMLSHNFYLATVCWVSLDRRPLCWLVWECVDNRLSRLIRRCYLWLDASCVVTVSPAWKWFYLFRFQNRIPPHRNATLWIGRCTTNQHANSYNITVKTQLKGTCIWGFEVLFKPPKWCFIQIVSFLSNV